MVLKVVVYLEAPEHKVNGGRSSRPDPQIAGCSGLLLMNWYLLTKRRKYAYFSTLA